ncbi:DUF4381 domain-containing protein, partial [Pseudomonas aeruginosa]|uniref:DUF4381 domain-containing protein n=1 Tax=Pseudomonas aeruginosa TaxID=287 RepID=UPI00188A043B
RQAAAKAIADDVQHLLGCLATAVRLLKRVCRARWPDSGSHALSGRAWLAFLDNRCPAAGLTRWMILVEGGYRADCTLDDKAVDGLDAAVATWIRKHV